MKNSDNSNSSQGQTLILACSNLAGSASDIRFLMSATHPEPDGVKAQISSLTKDLTFVLDLIESEQNIDPNQIYAVSDKLSETVAHLDVISSQLSTLGVSVKDRLDIYTELSQGIIGLQQKNDEIIAKNDPDGSINKIHQLDGSSSAEIKQFLISQASTIHKLTSKLSSVEEDGNKATKRYQDHISDLEDSRLNQKPASVTHFLDERAQKRELEQLKKDVAEQKDLERERHSNRGFFDTLMNN